MFGIEYAQNYRGHDRNEDLKSNIIRSFRLFVRGVSCVSVSKVFLSMVQPLVIGERLQ